MRRSPSPAPQSHIDCTDASQTGWRPPRYAQVSTWTAPSIPYGLAVGAGLEDLGKGLRSQVGTMYATKEKGVRYLEMAEGYVTGIALDADNEVIGYQFVSLGKMTDFIKKGDDPNTAWEKAKGQYGRVADAVKIIDPRQE